MQAFLENSFTGTPAAPWAPLVISGGPGSGKSTLLMIMATAFGARVCYKTRSKPRTVFDANVPWDEIDALIIDEIDGWDTESIRAAFPALLDDAKRKKKSLILIGQDVFASPIADLLPSDCNWMAVSNDTVRRLVFDPDT